MAKSTIERVHNYRKRLKDDPVKYEAYKLKDKKRKQKDSCLYVRCCQKKKTKQGKSKKVQASKEGRRKKKK